jgi:hypothetical protein
VASVRANQVVRLISALAAPRLAGRLRWGATTLANEFHNAVRFSSLPTVRLL